MFIHEVNQDTAKGEGGGGGGGGGAEDNNPSKSKCWIKV